MIVYVLQNKFNSKRYVGQTNKTAQKRLIGHIQESRKPRQNMLLSRAFQKYGEDAFVIEGTTIVSSQEEVDALERSLIKQLKTQDRKFGYNILDGGRGKTDNDRKRQSALMSEKYSSNVYRQKCAARQRTWLANAENRQLVVERTLQRMNDPALKRHLAETTSNHWQSLSDAQRKLRCQKLLDAARQRKIIQYAGQTVEVVDSIGRIELVDRVDFYQFARNLGLNPSTAIQAMKEKWKYKGYTFILRQQ